MKSNYSLINQFFFNQEREFVCPDQETGFYPEDPNICSASYYTCVNGVADPQVNTLNTAKKYLVCKIQI